MLRKVMTASLLGVDADFVLVETDVQPGLPGVNVVGLADTTIKEAKERIRPAVVNSGFGFPKRKITVNLSPAGLPKEGSHFDLPIAVGILGTENSAIVTEGYGFMGELSLDGALCGVRGALPLAMRMREEGVRKIVLPRDNAAEAALLEDVEIYPAGSLAECIAFLEKKIEIKRYIIEENCTGKQEAAPDFSEVIGQETAKRALMAAAAGNHGVLMIGSPGCGKTMMAKRLPYIMPEMTYEEMLEVTRIHSAAGHLDPPGPCARPVGRRMMRPFRAPHHTITKAALIGGGRIPKPGELSLAHNGILFLDEFGEFDPVTIELLRQPLEDGYIRLDREKVSVRLPSRVMLVAAANPCRCGYLGDEKHMCTCTEQQIRRYYSRFSGPMLDRIDIHLRVPNVSLIGDAGTDHGNAASAAAPEGGSRAVVRPMSTAAIRTAVQKAADIQKSRYTGTDIVSNGRLTDTQVKKYCKMTPEAEVFAGQAFKTMGFSMRTYYKLLKVARTLADLEASDLIQMHHIAEAVRYRSLDDFYRRGGDGR